MQFALAWILKRSPNIRSNTWKNFEATRLHLPAGDLAKLDDMASHAKVAVA